MLNTLFKKLNLNQDQNEDDKPKQVINGIILLYIAFILSMVTNCLDGIGAVPFFVLFLFISFLISSTNQAKNWARIVMLILVVFNIVLFAGTVYQLLNNSIRERFTNLVVILFAIEIVMEIVSMIFLFSKPANGWFSRKREEIAD